LFFRSYLEHPVLPERTSFIAAEAVIDERGKLWRIDPATEGRALLAGLNYIGGVKALSTTTKGRALIEAAARFPRTPFAKSIALPSEVAFHVREDEASDPFDDRNRRLVSWEDAKKDFGALLVLDERSPARVSVLPTSEPLKLWRA
jgi:hypothetical protein